MLMQLRLIAFDVAGLLVFCCFLITIAILEIADLLLAGISKVLSIGSGFLPKSRL
jgi:hypothetical protein